MQIVAYFAFINAHSDNVMQSVGFLSSVFTELALYEF